MEAEEAQAGTAAATEGGAPASTPAPEATLEVPAATPEVQAAAPKVPAAEHEVLGASARRRLRKEQMREELKDRLREQRKEKRRRQQHRRSDAWRERLEAMGPEEREAFLQGRRDEGRTRKATLQATLQHAFEAGRPRVAINCSFGSSMNHKELSSLAKQVQLSYTAVRDLQSTIQLHLTSVSEDNPALRSLEAIGFRGWLLHVHERAYWEAFQGDRIVVLSPDAEEDLDEVEEDATYVIGGLVDRSVSKMQSVEQAHAHDVVSIRRLPIKTHGPSGAHPVLNIDIVVRILAERLRRGDDWPGILSDCLPLRHSGQPTARMRRKRNALERRAVQQGGPAGPEALGPDGQEEDASGSSSDSGGSSECGSPGSSGHAGSGGKGPEADSR